MEKPHVPMKQRDPKGKGQNAPYQNHCTDDREKNTHRVLQPAHKTRGDQRCKTEHLPAQTAHDQNPEEHQ
eukprot:12910965-Prorocentrum_lima.AAC.1